jgi:prefoldin alpha subunit
LSSDDDRINNLLVEARLLEGSYNELASRQNLLERLLIESRSSLETLKSLEPGATEEVLIPVGAGVMLRSAPPKLEKVLVNIGSNVVVEKSKEDASKIMEERSKQLEESIISVATQRNQIAQRLETDRKVLQALVDRQGKK